MKKPKVLILGAGFGGLTAARCLPADFEVTLVDRHNFQTFLPLLYQVSTAGLAADHVAHPIRSALRKNNVNFRMGSPISIDHKNKSVKLDSSENLEFDYLIVALGSATNDFGIPGVKEHSLGMKSVTEALKIRSDIMRHFEDLCRFSNPEDFNISVIGGGPTGVEMAGAIAELIKGPLASDNEIAATHIKVRIIEAGTRLLPSFSEKLSAKTKSDLEKLGVTVLLNAPVKEVDSEKILLASGEALVSGLNIWTAGVTGEAAMKTLNLPSEAGRIAVTDSLQVKDYPYVFAIGDIAGLKDINGRYLPMVAPVAMQQARYVAKNLARLNRGDTLPKFSYIDKGSMATIGRHKAVVEAKGLKLSGFVAWYAWLWLHLFYLLGGLNKIGTMADWTWNYLTFDRGNRHILDI